MKIRKWQIVSVVIVTILVFPLSIFGSDNSARGVYGGADKSDALSGFPPLANFLYSADEIRENQYDIQLSPFAPLIFTLFWALFDAALVFVLGSLPFLFTRPYTRFRAIFNILLTLVLVPSILFTILTLLNNVETFRMFADFGIHRGGFGMDLSSALTDLLRVPFWTSLLALPNVVLLILITVVERWGSLKRVCWPHISSPGDASLRRAKVGYTSLHE